MDGKDVRYVAHIVYRETECYDDLGFATRTQCDAWWMCRREEYRRRHNAVRWNPLRKVYEVVNERGVLAMEVEIYAC
jgi:hypothetical protein